MRVSPRRPARFWRFLSSLSCRTVSHVAALVSLYEMPFRMIRGQHLAAQRDEGAVKNAEIDAACTRIVSTLLRFAPIFDYFWPSGLGPRVEEISLMKIDPYPWAAPLEDVRLKRR